MSEKSLTKRASDTPATAPTEAVNVFIPRVDIRESEDEVVLTADMPGVDEKSLDIALEGHELTISGKFQPKAPADYSLIYQEYDSGNFEREFTLGDTIDREAIKATVKDGVLNLTLPKAKEAQSRRIAVKAG